MTKVRLLLFLLLISSKVCAQNYAPTETYLVDSLDLSSVSQKDKLLIDSVLNLYNDCTSDLCKAKVVNLIVQESWDANVWPKYNRWVHNFTKEKLRSTDLDSATTAGLNVSYATALNNIGYLFNATDEIDSALYYYNKCLEIQQSIGDKQGMASTLINTGYIFLNKGLIEMALDYYYKSLAIQEDIGDQDGISTALNGIGYMQYKLGDNESALENYNRSLIIRRERNNDYGTATCLNNIGLVFKDAGEWDKALSYFEESIAIERKLEDKNGIAISLSNIGFIYKSKGQLNLALENYQESLQIMEALDDKSGIASALINIANVEVEKGNNAKAKSYALKSLDISQKIKFPAAIRDAAETLYKIATAMRQWAEALRYHELFIEMRDSVFNEETVTASIHQRYKYRYEKQALADSVRNANELQIQEAELMASEAETERLSVLSSKQQQQTSFLIFGVVLALAFSLVILNRMKTIKLQKATITTQNQELELQKKNLANFAHTISHDLKTPIGGIIGLINLVEYEYPKLDKSLEERLKLIKQSAEDSNKLIDGVLSYSEASRKSLEVSENDLQSLVEKIIADLPNPNRLEVKILDTLPSMNCNAYQISQVFTNLLSNALKYNDRPAGQGLVEIQHNKTESIHKFTISDNGPGIPAEEQASIFEVFKKGDHGEEVDSNGVGLSIVQQLINQNGGTIKLNSDRTEGASFTFTWPA